MVLIVITSRGTLSQKLLESFFCSKVASHALFPFVLVDLESLHSDWLTGVVHETMHHAFGP